MLNKILNTILIIIAIISVIFIVVVLGFTFSSDKKSTTNQITETPEEHAKYIEEQKEIGLNNLQEIRQAYKKNELTANDTYKGKKYNLYAKLDTIKEDGLMNTMLDKIGVTLTFQSENRIIYIFCDFKKNQRDTLSKYNKGDYILFSGICSSWGNWYDCEVLE